MEELLDSGFPSDEFDRSRFVMKSGVKLDTLKLEMEGMLGRLIFESCRLSFIALNLLFLYVQVK